MKDKEERALENQLMSQHKDFFSGVPQEEPKKDVDMFIDQKEQKKAKDLEK
jgi:hypothetical protein